MAAKYPRKMRKGNVSVTVYRVANARARLGVAYSVAFAGADGRRVQRRFFRQADAGRFAGDTLNQLAAGIVEVPPLSRADVHELHAARKLCAGTPLLSALNEWSRIREITGDNGLVAAEAWRAANGKALMKPVALDAAIDAFILEKESAGNEGELTYRSKLRALNRHFEGRNIQDIEARELTGFLGRFSDAVTRNDIRKRCVALWRWARDAMGWMPGNEMLQIEKTARSKEVAKRIGIITPEVFRRCLEWVRRRQPEDLAALVIAGFCGVRSDEIHGRRANRSRRQLWSDVHVDKKIMNVSAAKENTPAWRLVPLCDAALAWLGICERRDDGTLCRPCAMARVRKGLIAARIEIPENCFRHSFISHRIAFLDGNKPQVATEAGNSVAEIDRRYRVPLTKQDGAEWFGIMPARAV